MGAFSLLSSDPVESDLVSFPKTFLEFFNVWPAVDFESGWQIVVLLTGLFPGEEPSWAWARFLGQVDSVVSVDEPVVMGKVSLVEPEETLIRLTELEEVVEWPLCSNIEDFNTDFPDVVVEGSVGFDATEPVEWFAIILLDAVIVGESKRLREDFGVEGLLVFKIEPEFGFAGWGEGVTLLSKGLLEVDTAVGGLDVGFDGEEFLVYEVVLDEGEGLFFEGGERFVLVGSGLGHLI